VLSDGRVVGAGGAVEVTGGVRDLVRAASVIATVGCGALCTTCNYGEVVVVQPAAAAHGPFHLVLVPDPEDSAVARKLGWSGRVPRAEVTISPANSDTAVGPPVASLLTDGEGAASVADLPDGDYVVEVRRVLTAGEAAALAPTDDVVGFMAYAVVNRGEDTVFVPGSHRHSIVISEWAFNDGWIPGTGEYYFGGYLELANNSDTTVYLDGLVVGDAFALAFDTWAGACAEYEAMTNDPDGVWARYFDSVPGSGHTYPLAPGRTAVLATDAIDHSAVVPGGLDLSHADFEFIGEADVDNPSVPNLVDIGVASFPWFGHGPIFALNAEAVPFVALPIDVQALPRQRIPTGEEYVRVPRDRLLDVVAGNPTFQFQWVPCPHLVHGNFDRHPARMLTLAYKVVEVLSAHRKAAVVRPDGRVVLQHTRSGIADFYLAPRTPWSLPSAR